MSNQQDGYQKEVKLDPSSMEDDWAELMKKLSDDDAIAPRQPKAEDLNAIGPSVGDVTPLGIRFQEDPPRGTPAPAPVNPDDATHPAMNVSSMETPSRPMTRYEQLCKLPSMPMGEDDKKVMVDFSGVIAKVNEAGKAFSQLRHQFPDLIPAHLQSAVRENLRETSTVMLRELHNMRNGRQQKKYDNRYICKRCHSVFVIPLPGDRTCDECRASDTATAAPKPY